MVKSSNSFSQNSSE
jgi:hypothetical protein